jgi:hypothetical protein
MKSSRFLLSALLAGVLGGWCSSEAVANSEVLDVSIGPVATPRYLNAPRIIQPIGQTFTVAHSGKLSRIDLQMMQSSPGLSEPLMVRIVRLTPAGAPNDVAPALASTSVPASSFAPFAFNPNHPYISVPLGLQAPHVTTGDQLAVLLTTTQPYPFLGAPAHIWMVNPDHSIYSGGEMWYVNTLSGLWQTDHSDALMRTWVTIPEPSSAALVVAALVGVAVCRRKWNAGRESE